MKDLTYRGQENYLLEIMQVQRKLPMIEVAPDQWIASFVLMGDTELVEKCGKALADRLKKWELDCLVVPEGRGLPLAQVIAFHSSTPHAYLPYIVVRKQVKSYMRHPLIHSVSTITTAGEQQLVLDGADAARLPGSKVCILDDLISTGGTTRAVAELVMIAGAEVCCVAAVLLEGEETVSNPVAKTGGIPVVWLAAIPQFKVS